MSHMAPHQRRSPGTDTPLRTSPPPPPWGPDPASIATARQTCPAAVRLAISVRIVGTIATRLLQVRTVGIGATVMGSSFTEHMRRHRAAGQPALHSPEAGSTSAAR